MKSEHRYGACGCAAGLVAGAALGAVFALIFAGVLDIVRLQRDAQAASFANTPFAEGSDPEIVEVLKLVRAEHHMPAMSAAIVRTEGPPRIAAVGVRKIGADIPVTLGDLWHLGSVTKAMTAALAGLLVEDGTLQLDTTVGEVFPDLPRTETPGLPDLTLAQLLSHRSGLPRNLPRSQVSRSGSPVDQRLAALTSANENGLESAPEAEYRYSNLGYCIAGAMIEKATGNAWEEEIQARLFAPLGMESCGFGGTGTPGEIDQPWPHDDHGDPVSTNGPDRDNPPIFAPGGTVHCDVADWAKFIQDQLRGSRDETGLLDPETYRKMQTPPEGGDYAFGWNVLERGWAGGTALNHSGTNTMNYANVWIAPANGFAILVCTNQGGDEAFKATDAVVAALIKKLAQERP